MMTLTVVTRDRGVKLSEEQFDAIFGTGSFLSAKNWHRVHRQLRDLQSEQAAVEAAILGAVLAGSEPNEDGRVGRLRAIREEISARQKFLDARAAEERAHFAAEGQRLLAAWREGFPAYSLVSL